MGTGEGRQQSYNGDRGGQTTVLPVSEARSHSEEALACVGSLHRGLEAEERVVLHGALPQVLTRLLVQQAEHKVVLLLVTL